ncbi:hypothetical protein DFP72DRAFT_903318, partial [Ephemerocybe angulata]
MGMGRDVVECLWLSYCALLMLFTCLLVMYLFRFSWLWVFHFAFFGVRVAGIGP